MIAYFADLDWSRSASVIKDESFGVYLRVSPQLKERSLIYYGQRKKAL